MHPGFEEQRSTVTVPRHVTQDPHPPNTPPAPAPALPAGDGAGRIRAVARRCIGCERAAAAADADGSLRCASGLAAVQGADADHRPGAAAGAPRLSGMPICTACCPQVRGAVAVDYGGACTARVCVEGDGDGDGGPAGSIIRRGNGRI